MDVEGVIAGAAVALVATWFASWLYKREQRTERHEQENRLRALLANEIEANLREMFISMGLAKDIAKRGTYLKVPPTLSHRDVYNTLIAGPTALPPAETLAVSGFYSLCETMDQMTHQFDEVSDQDIRRAGLDVMSRMSSMVEDAGVEALRAMEAVDAVARVKADAARA